MGRMLGYELRVSRSRLDGFAGNYGRRWSIGSAMTDPNQRPDLQHPRDASTTNHSREPRRTGGLLSEVEDATPRTTPYTTVG